MSGLTPLLFSHPVYQYFERRYELNGHSLHWEPGEVPDEAEWSSFAELLALHPANLMVSEAEPLPETTHRLKALGVGTVVVDPAAAPGAGEDFLQQQLSNVERFQKVLRSH